MVDGFTVIMPTFNQAMDIAKYNHISYLPSDDFYNENHLYEIADKFNQSENIVLVFSGFRCDIDNNSSPDFITGCPGVVLTTVESHKRLFHSNKPELYN